MKPNILFIFADQHRKFDLGCYGNEVVKTPNMDALAEGGMRFTNCISNSPVCVPARGSLLTGLFPQKHGACTNDLPIRNDIESIADIAKNNGYHTGYIGKWHLCGIPREQFIDEKRRLGFETWKVANCNHNYVKCYYDDEQNIRHHVDGYEPEIFGKLAVDYIKEQKEGDKPWMLYLSFATPHNPHDAVGDNYKDLYKDIDTPLRANAKDTIAKSLSSFITREEVETGIKKYSIKGYYSHITAIDDQIGDLIRTLEETGQLENTMVVYTADHGEMLGTHGHVDKQLPYEESIGVPLIVHWQGKIHKGVTEELIGLVDLPTSIAGLLGMTFTKKTDGKDLHHLFVEEQAKGLDSCYMFDLYACHQAYHKGFKAWRAIRTKRYTYAISHDNLNWLLFDNEKDPYQQNNLAGLEEYSNIQQELFAKLSQHINGHDALVSGDDYILRSGLQNLFNESQAYFGLPLLGNN